MKTYKEFNLLIVDDLPNNLQLLANILRNKDYKIALATSGAQALEIVKDTKFDLILLDIMMPEMNGIEVCQRLKRLEETRSIPIIFLTALTDTDSIIEGFEAGAVDYITKPFNDKELVKRVETHVELIKKEAELLEFNALLEEKVKERTRDLNIERKRAEVANRAKTLFLANMNHELRTPLNSIMGFSSLLQESNLGEEQAEYVNIINNSSHDLLKLITEILEYTNIESTLREKNEIEVNPSTMISEAVNSIAIQAIRKGIRIQNRCPDQLPNIVTDIQKVKQILINLFSNAIKFTSRGEILIDASISDDHSEKPFFSITVTDSGIGIAPDKLDLIFEEFYQVDEDFTRQYEGLGLGLSLAKCLADAINGRITVESSLGKGSSFTLVVPVKKADKHAISIPEEPAKLPSNINILVAEDNLLNQELIRLVLKQKGYNVTIAANGRVAVDLAKENKYDLIFMDIQMPVMDGIEATIEIRKITGQKETPIIAFTAHTTPEDRQMCIKAGMNDMINKPLRKNIVFDVIAKYCV
jgi:two-component system, sensor histidine kinase